MITNLEIGYNGRLGNQLFQYAVCYVVSKKLNTEFGILKRNINNIKQDGCYDFSNNQWIPYRFVVYDGFNITAPLLSTIDIENIFKEPHFHYTELINNIKNNTSIQGYFQSEKYFVDYKEDILKEFTFKKDILSKAIDFIKDFKNNEIVSIHIRRGDNIINPAFPLISMDYIQQALNVFSDKEYNFLVISDDVSYCKEIFPDNKNIKISTGENDFIDMCLMSLSDHNIISNSSFSWWGAYLNKNKNKKIISPSDWFKDKTINTNDLIPDNWIII
jgi:hypothetical protein